MHTSRHYLAVFSLLLISGAGISAQARTVTDSAGRTVTIPNYVERVYAAGPPASVLLYVLAPDRLVGWPRAPSGADERFIPEIYRGLPETGRLTGRGNTANLEVVLRNEPDLIVDFGAVSRAHVSLADRTQAHTGVPYLLIDGTFENTAAALRLMGDVLGVRARANDLAAYVEDVFENLDAALADIPVEDRPRVYLARTPTGLETGLAGSINTEIIERAGGRNVAESGITKPLRQGLAQISIEQVLLADPDTVVTWDRNFYARVWTDPLWQGIDAVQRGRVYLAPTSPFGWIDRPPSINRVIGLRWMSGLFYPQRMPFDRHRDTQEFYRLFYHVDLSDEQLDRLVD